MTLSALLSSTRRSLRSSGVANPDVEAELIISHVFGLKRAEIYLDPGREVAPSHETRVAELLEARARRYPLQYLLGEIEFMGLPLKIREGVFIPRPETEILVEELLKRAVALGAGLAILDICTGSGAIAIALARYLTPRIVVATDISIEALKLASENARLARVEGCLDFVQARGLEPIGRRASPRGLFDIVTSNPPYVPSAELASLQPEVRDFEPRATLDGGPDGLSFIAGILPEIPSILKPGGIVAFEIGSSQASEVSKLLREIGLADVDIIKDLAGRDRVAVGIHRRG